MMSIRFLFTLGILISQWPALSFSQIEVSTDFPGGSAEVLEIDQEKQVLRLNPGDYPERGWRCWWYVKVSGLTPGKPFTLDVGEGVWATPDRATFSIDDGKTWQHTVPGKREGKRIVYEVSLEKTSAQFAWGPPFVPTDAEALVADMAAALSEAEAVSLCETREGRNTPAIRISKTESGSRPLIWIQARQHAWESGSSWVAKGFGEWAVSDQKEAVRFRELADLVFVPIMDIDNVHRGAGGKSQTPQDHNRDWTETPHWNAVAAAQKFIRAAAEENRLAAFVDLHNPGSKDLFPYFYLPEPELLSKPALKNQAVFLAAAKKRMTGPLRFTGRTIVSGSKYDPKAWKAISKNWVATLGSDAVSVTLETTWNSPASTTEGYQTVGRQLGLALVDFLEKNQNP